MLPLLLQLLWAGSLAQETEYTLNIRSPVTVQEGLCVEVPCDFTFPEVGSPSEKLFGSWFQEGNNALFDDPVATSDPTQQAEVRGWNHFLFSGNVSANNCSFVIRNARKQDEGQYYFSVTKGTTIHNYEKSMLSLFVTDNTVVPSVFTPESMYSGHLTNVTCLVPQSCEWETPPFFTWLSPVVSTLGPRTKHSATLLLTPVVQDNGTKLTCQVHYSITSVVREKVVQINVLCSPENPETCTSPTGKLTTTLGWIEGAIIGSCITALLGVFVYVLFYIKMIWRKRATTHPAKETASSLNTQDFRQSSLSRADSKVAGLPMSVEQQQPQLSNTFSTPEPEEEMPTTQEELLEF